MELNEQELLNRQLWRCDTLGQMLNFIIDRYQVRDLKVPVIYKAVIIQGLAFAISILKPKPNLDNHDLRPDA